MAEDYGAPNAGLLCTTYIRGLYEEDESPKRAFSYTELGSAVAMCVLH